MATIQKVTTGKYKARVSFGSDSNGSRQIKTKVFHGNERDVKKQVAEWEAGVRAEGPAPEPVEAPTDDDPARPTFAKVLRVYIDVTSVEKKWEPEHLKDRERHLTEIADTPLGGVVLEELRREHLAAHIKDYTATPSVYGRPRGASSIRARKIVFRAVVGYAIDDPDIIVRGNPGKGIDTSDDSVRVAEREILTIAGFSEVIDSGCDRWDELVSAGRQCRPGYPHRAEMARDVFKFALLSGMRRGEVCGLRTTDVTHNEDGSATLLVRFALKAVAGGGWTLKRLKTGWHRAITVPAPAAAILLRRQVANETLAMSDGVTPPANGFVFSMGWGTEPLMPGAVSDWWEKLRDIEAGIADDACLKDLRHSHASHLHSLGFHDKAIAEHMGHTVEVSKETYNHVRPGHDVILADAIGAAFV